MQFKIEKGIPIPPRSGGRAAKYPFKEMQVGDSIFLPINQSTASAFAKAACRNSTMKFTTRKEADGTRVWRVE